MTACVGLSGSMIILSTLHVSVDLDPYIGGFDCFRSIPRKAASAVVMVPFLACLVLQIVEYFILYDRVLYFISII